MMTSLFTGIIGFTTISLNFYVTATALKRKKSLWLTIGIFLSIAVIYNILQLLFPQSPFKKQLYLFFLLPIFLMFEGRLFHKLYMFFTVVFRCTLIVSAVGFTLQWILPYGTDLYIQVYIIAVLAVYGIYALIVTRFARNFYRKLFALTSQREWGFYTLGLVLTYNAFRFLYFGKGILPQKYIEHPFSYVLVFLASIGSFSILCYAIIKTHEKTSAEYNLKLTKSILSTGQEYYKKLHEQQELVQILRHDYKYQLNAVQGLLQVGERIEAENLLEQFQQKFEEQSLPSFCENAVINAQIAEFYQRCKDHNIDFNANIILPADTGIDNYELCILLGNLLENAWDACIRSDLTSEKWITVNVKLTTTQMAVQVQNSFDGVVVRHDDAIASRKSDGGMGIKSIQAITTKYGGEYMPDWNKNVFTAYVLLNLRIV